MTLTAAMVAAWLTSSVVLPLASAPPPLLFTGICDASAVEAIDEDLVVLANDEDNLLRVYSRHRGGGPVGVADLSAFLQLPKRGAEVDLEGAAVLGDLMFWISSHGRNANGKPQESRHRLFATTAVVHDGAVELKPVGVPYRQLLRDLVSDPRLAPFHLAAAASLPPKARGALNIEGLCATPEGWLLLGFRNPIPHGKALLVPLLNPADLLAGRPARLGDPRLLDLHGQGIRSITYWRGRYLIVAGSYDGNGVSHLCEWSGGDDPPRWLDREELRDLNPEAITCLGGENADQLFIASDDGTLAMDGKPCKRLKDPNQKQFRAVCLELGDPH